MPSILTATTPWEVQLESHQMGAILKATCDCGYSGTGTCSSGRREHGRAFYYPHLCTQCQEVVSPDLLAALVQCPGCGNTELTPYGTVELYKPAPARTWWQRFMWWSVGLDLGSKKKSKATTQLPVDSSFCFVQKKTFSIPREQYKCPKCGDKKLHFQLEALFD